MNLESNPVLPKHKIRKIWKDIYGANLPGDTKLTIEGYAFRGVFSTNRPEGEMVAKFDRLLFRGEDITGIARMRLGYGGPDDYENNLLPFCIDIISNCSDNFYDPSFSEPVADEEITIIEKEQAFNVPLDGGVCKFSVTYTQYIIEGSVTHVWNEVHSVAVGPNVFKISDPVFAELLDLATWFLESQCDDYKAIIQQVQKLIYSKISLKPAAHAND